MALELCLPFVTTESFQLQSQHINTTFGTIPNSIINRSNSTYFVGAHQNQPLIFALFLTLKYCVAVKVRIVCIWLFWLGATYPGDSHHLGERGAGLWCVLPPPCLLLQGSRAGTWPARSFHQPLHIPESRQPTKMAEMAETMLEMAYCSEILSWGLAMWRKTVPLTKAPAMKFRWPMTIRMSPVFIKSFWELLVSSISEKEMHLFHYTVLHRRKGGENGEN